MNQLHWKRYRRLARKALPIGGALILGLGAVLFVWLGAAAVSPPAAPTPSPGDLCVNEDGSDGCFDSIGAALEAAAPGDRILVAAGDYHENVLISQTVTLEGGWAPDFSLRDRDVWSSTIRPADNSQSVVAIQGQSGNPELVAPTLDGFVISGGRAELGFNHGGGLRIVDSDALVISNTIRDNSAFLLGGGVWVQRGAPLLRGNRIEDNFSLGGGIAGVARGGGVQLEDSGAALLTNTITGNRAGGQTAFGGGVDIVGSAGISVTLEANLIRLNATESAASESGFGGGVAIGGAWVDLANNLFISNTASIDGAGGAGALGYGGGLFLSRGRAQLRGNDFFGNRSGFGGGIALVCLGDELDEDCWNVGGGDNRLRHNRAGDAGGGLFIAGSFEDCCNVAGNGNRIESNSAERGGGLFIGGTADGCCAFNGRGTQVAANKAMEGGGLYNAGQRLTLRGGHLISNTAAASGGGALIGAGGSFSFTNSVAAANEAAQDGGAIHNSGFLTVANSTVSGNTAGGMGGGIANENVADLTNATVAANAGPGGAGFFNGAFANSVNSLLAVNDGDNCLGAMNSLGHNLDDGLTCAFGQPTDITGTAAALDPLGDNGGSTPTHALAAASPAVDAGDNAACPPADQRGAPRPVDGDGDGTAVCDIGAFEYRRPTTTTIRSDTPDPSAPGEPFTVTVAVSAAVGVPTGAVTATVAGAPQQCTLTLAGGQGACSLALATPGAYTLTATYGGSGPFGPSSATAAHTVEEADRRVYLPLIIRPAATHHGE